MVFNLFPRRRRRRGLGDRCDGGGRGGRALLLWCWWGCRCWCYRRDRHIRQALCPCGLGRRKRKRWRIWAWMRLRGGGSGSRWRGTPSRPTWARKAHRCIGCGIFGCIRRVGHEVNIWRTLRNWILEACEGGAVAVGNKGTGFGSSRWFLSPMQPRPLIFPCIFRNFAESGQGPSKLATSCSCSLVCGRSGRIAKGAQHGSKGT